MRNGSSQRGRNRIALNEQTISGLRSRAALRSTRLRARVQAAVDVSGPTDFTTMHDPDRIAFLRTFLAADYTRHPEVWRNASPVSHVAKSDAPFLIVHGTQDQSVSMDQPQELYGKLKAAGGPVSFIKVNDVHTFRTPEARRRLAIETLEFFKHSLAVAK